MKKAKKVLLLVLCAVLLVGATVAGTLAYLTANDSVTNTFTVGKVEITLDEAKVDEYGVEIADADRVDANEYKLIPGHTYTKDPTIHVAANSEDCWLFVKIENGLGANATFADQDGWTNIKAENGDSTNYWYYNTIVHKSESIQNIRVFGSFTYANLSEVPTADASANIQVTAYAIQADNLTTYQAAWTALSGQLNLN